MTDKNKRNVHKTGALAAILNSGDITNAVESQNKTVNTQQRASSIDKYFHAGNEEKNIYSLSSQVLTVDPQDICNWELHDRPQNELGNIEALANDMKLNGQAQPCIVRPYKNSAYKYELIVGERRWRAAQLVNIKLKVIVEDLDDYKAAIKQSIENENREGLSDYAKGMSLSRFINKNVLKAVDVEQKLNMTKLEVSRLLSFSQLPQEITEAIGNMSLVSSRTSAEIRALANKGEQFVSALIKLAPKIRSGKLGGLSLPIEVNKLISPENAKSHDSREVKDPTGRHLFTWRLDSNKNISISFPKDIRESIDKKSLESTIYEEILDQLNKIQGTSKQSEELKMNN